MKSGPFKLQYFNPALVDHFCTELTLYAVADPENYLKIGSYIHNFSQKRDFRKALLLAEQYIPLFHNSAFRQQIQGHHLETWIKAIHQRASKTVLKEWKLESGKYSNDIIFRWEKLIEFGDAVETVLNAPRNHKPNLQALFQKNRLAEVFPAWFQALFASAKIKFDEKTSKVISSQETQAGKYLYRLAYARHLGYLTPEQNVGVDLVCKVVMPDTIPQKMKAFCESLAERIRHCDGELENVVDLAAFAFQSLTIIHPFPNGNGRVSNILLNLILVGFNYPSIVLRKQIDRDDETTHYNFVISKMDQDLSLLKDYIKMKILVNQKSLEKGTNESTPHIFDPTKKLIDGYLSLIKPCKQKVQEYKTDPVKTPPAHLNHFLKIRANAMGQDYGYGMMFLHAFVDYSDEEMKTVQRGTIRY